VFAFFFDFWEMAMFVLFGVLVVNWQPAMSLEIFLFAFLPLLTFALHNVFRSQRWRLFDRDRMRVLPLLCHYRTTLLLGDPVAFFEDLFVSLMAGGLVFLALRRINK